MRIQNREIRGRETNAFIILFYFTSCVGCSNLISFELVEIGHSFHFGRNDSTSSSGELVRVLGNTHRDP